MRGKALVALALGGVVARGVGCKSEDPPSPPASTAALDSTGVAECDSLLQRMTSCYANTTVASQMAESIAQMREKFKADVHAEGKEAVRMTCFERLGLLEKNPACAGK